MSVTFDLSDILYGRNLLNVVNIDHKVGYIFVIIFGSVWKHQLVCFHLYAQRFQNKNHYFHYFKSFKALWATWIHSNVIKDPWLTTKSFIMHIFPDWSSAVIELNWTEQTLSKLICRQSHVVLSLQSKLMPFVFVILWGYESPPSCGGDVIEPWDSVSNSRRLQQGSFFNVVNLCHKHKD